MRTITLLLALLLFTAVHSFGGELDTYYLQQFGELADTTKYAVKSTEEASIKKCGMPLKHDLRRDWQKLEGSTQKTLAKYLEKPLLAGEQIITSNGGHFKIHYAPSGTDAPRQADTNSNSIPDWVETVAATFEAVYTSEITEMGYSVPPAAPYNVYLKNMSFFGLTDSDVPTGQYPNSYSSYITIENDFAEHSFQASIPGDDSPYEKSVKALQITAAHEFHHVIQFGINYYFESWYSEATSSWMEDEVFDPVNQLYSYANDYLANTAPSLDSKVPGIGYSRWIYNRSIFEQYSNQDIIWKIWEEFATEPALPSGDDIPMLPFIDTVLKSQGGSLSSSFFGFAKKTYLHNWSSHSDDIAYLDAVAPSRMFTADTFHTVQNPNLPAYAFTYYAFSHSTHSTSTLTLNYPDKPAEYQVVAFKDSNKTEYYYNETTKTLTITDFGANDTIYLLICNNSTVSTSPPEPPVNTGGGGGGGGGGCFIATAAYGSYLHPEVMTLRHFRDTYLLTNLPGRAFVAAYYRFSPPIADFIREHDTLRAVVRCILIPIIFAIKHGWLALSAAIILAMAAVVRICTTCSARKVPVN